MKRALLLSSCLASLVGAAAVAPGCSTLQSVQGAFLKGEVLSYEQYLSVDQTAVPTPTSEIVLKTFGAPMAVRDQNGSVRRIEYHCWSLDGDLKIAEFTFDESQRLVKKQLW